MSSRALRPPNPSLSYTLLPPPDDAPIKDRPQGSRVTKTRSSNRITKGHSVPTRSTKSDNSSQFNVKNLPNAPWFQPIVHQQGLHKAYNTLPVALRNIDVIEPHLMFQLFFNDEIFETICTNTNLYAADKKAKKATGDGKGMGRKWVDTSMVEIKCWLGIVIYMGVVNLPAVRDFWRHDGLFPTHDFATYMTQMRFEDIKGCFHVTPPHQKAIDDSGRRLWHGKVELLMQQVRNSSQNYRVPFSYISIDEAMIRCTGRSQDTYKTPFKPISEGLKFHCAADHGFIFDFHSTSQKHGPDPIAQDIMEEGLSNTSSLVLEMISRLPKHLAFNLYLDNYYTSLPLLSSLRKKGVGACGTARTSSKMFPPELVVPKNKSSQLGYHERAGMVVDEVAIMLWMDNAPVSMMTTIHQLKGRGSEVQKERRPPGLKSSNAAGIRKSKIFDEGE